MIVTGAHSMAARRIIQSLQDPMHRTEWQSRENQVTAFKTAFAHVVFIVVYMFMIPHAGLSTEPDGSSPNLEKVAARLKPIHKPMGPVRPGDWLESHEENGQTYRQYLRSRPVKLTRKRKVLYVLPIGDFDTRQTKIIDLSAEFLGIYFGCRVRKMDTLSLDDVIPAQARRVHPSWGVRQIKSTYVLNKVLPPRLPDDAVALIAFTTSDLYPDEDWNFVFGQASLRNRVGVWSIFRNGDPEKEFQLCLRRTLKTATHETGHMFSMAHCIEYDCNMCGSNNRSESDRRPLYLCPQCVPKVWWSTKSDPEERFKKLADFCRQNGFPKDAEFYARSLELVSEK